MLGIKISDLDPIPIPIFSEILNLRVNGTFILEGTQIRSKKKNLRGIPPAASRALLCVRYSRDLTWTPRVTLPACAGIKLIGPWLPTPELRSPGLGQPVLSNPGRCDP
jgi:hypothetical protein